MAGPPCMSNDGNAAVFVGTFLENGDSVALCGDCLPGFTMAITASMSGVEIEALTAFLDSQQPGQVQDPAAAAAEHAAPAQHAEPPERGGEPPAEQPADDDPEAGWDFTRPTNGDGPTSSGSSAQLTGTAAADESPPPKPARKNRTAS